MKIKYKRKQIKKAVMPNLGTIQSLYTADFVQEFYEKYGKVMSKLANE